jgi:hypothetical protein
MGSMMGLIMKIEVASINKAFPLPVHNDDPFDILETGYN